MAQRLRGPIWRPTISKLEQKFTMKIRFRSTQSREKLPGSAKSFIFCVSIFFICSTVFYSTSSLDCYQTDSQSFQSLLHRPIRTRMNERTNERTYSHNDVDERTEDTVFPRGCTKGGEEGEQRPWNREVWRKVFFFCGFGAQTLWKETITLRSCQSRFYLHASLGRAQPERVFSYRTWAFALNEKWLRIYLSCLL